MSLQLVKEGRAGMVEGGEFTHLMNEGCRWLLGEESSFNMSLERGGSGRLYRSRVGRYVRDGVWQEETVGHWKEWWPWRTQIYSLHLGCTKCSILCACDCDTQTLSAVITGCMSVCASALKQFFGYLCVLIFKHEHGCGLLSLGVHCLHCGWLFRQFPKKKH